MVVDPAYAYCTPQDIDCSDTFPVAVYKEADVKRNNHTECEGMLSFKSMLYDWRRFFVGPGSP